MTSVVSTYDPAVIYSENEYQKVFASQLERVIMENNTGTDGHLPSYCCFVFFWWNFKHLQSFVLSYQLALTQKCEFGNH